jgi:hypothetical protein
MSTFSAALIQGGLIPQPTPTAIAPVTVVLVHGAFADASSRTGVIEQLQAKGVQVTAPAPGACGVDS